VFDPIADATAGTGFAMIAGAEHFYLEALTRGAVGVIGGGCNTHPEIIYAVEHHYRAGRLDRARVAQEQVNQTLEEWMALGLQGAAARKLYVAAQGYPMQPYDCKARELPSAEVVRSFAEIIDRRVGPYRTALQEGRELP
jgi:dihydrodipicolinate synthase/N-acetylneuraminate lyase